MPDLLPTEYWEYNLRDIMRGLDAAFRHKPLGISGIPLFIPGIGSCIPARSARSAIVVAIKALNLTPGARIGVPLYSCPVVFKAIKAAGCRPCFIDVEAATCCMSAGDLAPKSAQIDAAIAIHMFGNTCEIPELQKAAQGKPIIEDCAQSLGSRVGGKMAGSIGTIAAFSFRSGKYLSVGEGGALFSDHADLCSRMSRLISMMPAPSYAGECAHVIKTYVRSLLRKKPLWGIVGQRIWTIYNNKVEFSAKSPLVLNQIYRADFANTIHRLDNLQSAIERQRSHAEYYLTKLKLNPDMMCHETPGSYFNRYMFPIIFPSNKDRDFMAAYLFRRKISTAKPYQDIVDVAEKYFGYSGDCPVAEKICKRLLIIPNHYALRKKDIQYIAKCFNEGLAELKYDTRD